MRLVCSVVALLACSCNEVYGLDATIRRDAAFYDAGDDPPAACPPIGTPPQFSPRFRQVIPRCIDFGVARTGRTLASCVEPGTTTGYRNYEGTLDGPMTLAPGFDAPNTTFLYPRIAPDGETAIIRIEQATTVTFAEYTRGPTAWTRGRDLPALGTFTTTAKTANRHLLAGVASDGLHELVDDGATFVPLQLHSNTALGLEEFSSYINVTADGLRLLVVGRLVTASDYQLLYTDRADDMSPFAPMRPLPALDFLGSSTFMTEDCGKLYLSGLGHVFVAELER